MKRVSRVGVREVSRVTLGEMKNVAGARKRVTGRGEGGEREKGRVTRGDRPLGPVEGRGEKGRGERG